MGLSPSIAALLASLVATPSVQSGIRGIQNGLGRNVTYGAGPLSGGTSGSNGGTGQLSAHQLGASLGGGSFRKVPNPANGMGLGADLGSVLGGLGQGLAQQQDPLAQLYQQLVQQLQTPVTAPTGIDTEDLMRQVQSALNPIYDSREKVAQNQNAQAQAGVQGLYKQLAAENEKLAPQQVAQSKDAQKQISDLYGQLRSNIEGSYSRVSQQQGDEFKQLGIEAALPDVMAKQDPAVTDATTAASQNQATQQQRYMDIGQTDADYYRQQAPIAMMEGDEKSVDLYNQLQNYVQQTEGERSSGIQTGYLQQLGSAQSALAQQQSQAASQTQNNQQMLWQMLQSQLQGQNQASNQKVTPDSFMSQLPEQVQQSVGSAFNSLQRSPEAVYGKVQDPRSPVPGTFVDTTPQWYESQADKMLQSGQIDPATHQALLMYIQLYYGNG